MGFSTRMALNRARETRPDVTADAPQPRSVVDWPALTTAAIEAMHTAYAPYSHYPVGAAGLADDGRIVTGCNVENASYPVGLCAECGMVSDLIRSGGGRLAAVTCVDRAGTTILPCGRCRQLLWEHGGPDCLVLTPQGPMTMTALLPRAFGPEHLEPNHPARGTITP